MLRDLAEVLAARSAPAARSVDAGWMPYSHQVGQTGKTVCPKLYIACGISGSVQHMAGMQSADFIIAINKDPDAEIFQIANLGIVGDVMQIVPALTKAFKDSLAKIPKKYRITMKLSLGIPKGSLQSHRLAFYKSGNPYPQR